MLVKSQYPLPRPSPSALRARFEDLIAELDTINVEEARNGVGRQDRMPVVQVLLDRLGDALALHGDALSLYDRKNGEEGNPEQQKLADLAFMAVAELRQIEERIEQTPNDVSAAAAVSIVDDGVRRVRTSLSSVMGRLCNLEGLEIPQHFAAELAASLVIRKAYARLRRTITDTRPALDVRIRASKIELAVVRGRPFFLSLSVDDREAIIGLHARTIEWLRLPESPEKRLAGERVWTDLCGVGNELGKIHLRQELVQHDRELLRFAEKTLNPTDPVAPDLLAQLHDLEGLSPALDRLLAQKVPNANALLEVTQELRQSRYRDSFPPSQNDISGSWSTSWIQ